MRIPGYYYYQNKRALIGLPTLCPILLGAIVAQYMSFTDLSTLELFEAYRVPLFFIVAGLVALMVLVRKLKRFFGEPQPADYPSRAAFINALSVYCARRGYQPGWVYYRSQELWPE